MGKEEQKRFLWLGLLRRAAAYQQMSVTKRESTTVMSIFDVIVGHWSSVDTRR